MCEKEKPADQTASVTSTTSSISSVAEKDEDGHNIVCSDEQQVLGEEEGSDEDEEEDDDSLYEEVGILFEGARDTTLKHFSWENVSSGEASSNKPIHVALSCIDEEPGAVQSGHYLWPASTALCEYLISTCKNKREETTTGDDDDKHISPSFELPVKSILELGAGTALTSLVSIQLFHKTLEFVVVTDHDPTALERARDNYETTMMELYDQAASEEEKEAVINEVASVLVEFIPLKWGQTRQWKNLERTIKSDHNFLKTDPPVTFDLVLGSDLVYCVEVVEPLLRTVERAMEKTVKCGSGGRFILSQSFAYDSETEKEIDRVCEKLKLQRRVLVDRLSEDGSKILEFRFVL